MMNLAKYKAANDEIALLLKEWERAVDAFCISEAVVENAPTRNVSRGYFEYAARDCSLAFTRILDGLLDKEIEERESFETYYAALKDWRESIERLIETDQETMRLERRRF